MGTGESRQSQLPCSFAVRAGGRLPCLHPSPPQKSNLRRHHREGQGVPDTLQQSSWSIVETGPGMAQLLCRLALPGEELLCCFIPLAGAFYGSSSRACLLCFECL